MKELLSKIAERKEIIIILFTLATLALVFGLAVHSCSQGSVIRRLKEELVMAKTMTPPKTIPATQPSPGVVIPRTTLVEEVAGTIAEGLSKKASETIKKALESDGRRVALRTEVVAVLEGGESPPNLPSPKKAKEKVRGQEGYRAFPLEWPPGFYVGLLTLPKSSLSGSGSGSGAKPESESDRWGIKWGRREYMVTLLLSGIAPSPKNAAPGVALVLRARDEKGHVIELPITKAETSYAHRPELPPKPGWSFDPRPELSLWGGVGLTLSSEAVIGEGLSGGFGATLGTHLFRYGTKGEEGRTQFKVLGLHAGIFGLSTPGGSGADLRPTFGMVLSPVTVTLPLLRNTTLGAGIGLTVTGVPKTPVTPLFTIGLSLEL